MAAIASTEIQMVKKYITAGIIAATTISRYSAIRKAPAAMTGGMIWPPIAAEETAAAERVLS